MAAQQPLHNLGLAQQADFFLQVTQLLEHLIRVFSEYRRTMADLPRRLRQPHRGIGQGNRFGRTGVFHVLQQLARLDLWVFEHLAWTKHGARGDAGTR